MKKFIIALITSITDDELAELMHYAELECELRMNKAEYEPEPEEPESWLWVQV